MTDPTRPRRATQAELDHLLLSGVPPEQLLARLARHLYATAIKAGADRDTLEDSGEIDQAIADQIGVSRSELSGYHAVCYATERYQRRPPTAAHPTPRRPID